MKVGRRFKKENSSGGEMCYHAHTNTIIRQYLINQSLMASPRLFTFSQVTTAILSLAAPGVANENKGWKSIALV